MAGFRNALRRLFHRPTRRPLGTTKSPDYEEFYRFTSGRWLWDEKARLQERYKKFSVPGLKHLAVKASGAQSCLSITKLAEGGFNKVFRLSMDNGSVVIARIPNPNIGSAASKVIASEVATMDFVQNVIGIPVPKVLGWDAGVSNSAESEYILMEEAKGTQLGELWTDMDLDDKLKIIDDVVAMQKKLQSVMFSRYGNLYFKSNAIEGCLGVELAGQLSDAARAYAEERFAIGPVAERSFWRPGTTSALIDRGPWPDAQTYLRAISQRERSKTTVTQTASQDSSQLLESPEARLSLLEKFDAVSPYIPPTDPSLDVATLFHWDLRAPNIFVDNGQITSVIDWQDCWIGPLFMQERRPQLIEYYGEMILRLPDYYEGMEDMEEKAKLTDKVERSILYWCYTHETQTHNPTLQRLFDLPLARTRRELVLFTSDIWDGETIPLRESLYKLQQHWEDLQTGIPCPISFTSEEMDAHDRAAAGWNTQADFWSSLEGFVSRDGYTSNEDYERARELFQELREESLAH